MAGSLLSAGTQIAPPLPFVPEDRHGDTFAIAVVHFTGPIEAGDAAMAPFRELAPRVGEMVAPMPYPWLNSAFDAIFPKGIRSYWKGYTRLVDIKPKYDPDNLFHGNQNIKP